MRLLVAILVGLGQVAGPWLCCCPTARTAAPAVASAPAEPTCPQCRKLASESPQGPTSGLPDPCPCGGSAVLMPVTPVTTGPAVAFTFDDPAILPTVPAVGVTPVPAVGVSELPFLPPGARLFVHHVLRC